MEIAVRFRIEEEAGAWKLKEMTVDSMRSTAAEMVFIHETGEVPSDVLRGVFHAEAFDDAEITIPPDMKPTLI